MRSTPRHGRDRPFAARFWLTQDAQAGASRIGEIPRFGDIANKLKITRANIHYHYRTTSKLGDEVIAQYLSGTLKEMSAVWESDLTYEEKVVATMDSIAVVTCASTRACSLISRMR